MSKKVNFKLPPSFPLFSSFYILLSFSILLRSWPVFSSTIVSDLAPDYDDKVNELLKKMSLEEKIGQMTQITLEVVSRHDPRSPQSHELDEGKLREALVDYKVGSILNVVNRGFTLDHWHAIITKMQDMSLHETINKIPVLYGIDAIHGATYTLGATLFPQPISMAATWNPELLKREGAITALEVRASGIPWNFYPVLDLGRNPVWPRFWETFGEDTYLTATLGASYIQGHQGDGLNDPRKAAVCLKHYVGYSAPASGRDRTPAFLTERMLRELYLPPFAAAIGAGAPSIMVNSGEIDGVPGHANQYLLTQVLRKELGFKGVVLSDWADIERLYTRDRVARSPEEAVMVAVMAGVDMSMVPYDYSFPQILKGLVLSGKVPQWRIDQAVGRILKMKLELGLFDRPYPDQSLKTEFAQWESTALNRQAAGESITLLKNDGNLLPLSKEMKVLVTGPSANSLMVMNGGWTITWQGDDESLYPKDKKTILEAITAKLGKEQVTFVPGSGLNSSLDMMAAVEAAKKNDVTIICLGERPYAETPGNIDDLTLDWPQLQLAMEIIKLGRPVVLVLIEGRPRVINLISDGAQAILMGYLPGMEGGEAMADVLFGDVNPSGKLPFSYPRFVNAIVPYDHKPAEEADGNSYNPLFPFGHGLSYSKFEYSDLAITPSQDQSQVVVDVLVRNVGKRTGKEVVQLYLTDLYGSVTRPVKQLKGFQKVELEPGQGRRVTFTLTTRDLSFVGRDLTWIFEPGEFKVSIGQLEEFFTLTPAPAPTGNVSTIP